VNEINLFGVVGQDIQFQAVQNKLDAADRSKMLTVRIHSEGGSVFDGLALYDSFKAYEGPKRAIVESLAGSIASYIMTAFDDVEIAENGFVMIHEPHSPVGGDSNSHKNTADLLAKLRDSMISAYADRMQVSADQVGQVMAKETWYSAEEALKVGLVSSIGKAKRAPLEVSNTVPQWVFASIVDAPTGSKSVTPKEPEMSEPQKPAAASIADIERILPKAESTFVLDCVKKNMTLAEVSEAALTDLTQTNETLATELEAAKAENAELQEAAKKAAEATPAPQAKTGQLPIATSGSGSPVALTKTAEWKKAVNDAVSSGMSRANAVARVNRDQPGLREEMLAEVNKD